MKLGIVISSNDPETVWNAFRFGNHALTHGDSVDVFLLGQGVEAESLDTEQFAVTEQMSKLVSAGGCLFACGTCLKLRQSEESATCPISTMNDLYRIVAECDKVLTF
jgi:uncharacterized protein involved in oxidation of intracellular sulfur